MISYKHNSFKRRIWRQSPDCDNRIDGAYYNGFTKIFVIDGSMTKKQNVMNKSFINERYKK